MKRRDWATDDDMRDLSGIDGRRPHVSSPRNYTNARRGIACGWFHFVLREFAYVQGRRTYLPARIGSPMCYPQFWPRRVNCKPCAREAKVLRKVGFFCEERMWTIQKVTVSGVAINSIDRVQIKKKVSTRLRELKDIFGHEKQIVSHFVSNQFYICDKNIYI